MIDEATGHPELAAPRREQTAKILVRPETLTTLAANLALRGKLDEAFALIPKAVAAAHDNSAVTFSWLYFQWGRLYEQAGQLAMARDLFAEAHRRMPGYLEAIVHLAQTMSATGQDPTALLTAALRTNQHPELLALAGKTAEAKAAWERYLTALPEAFADHAARFYLGPGADPARALVLAKANLANRDTTEARSLAAEAALAAADPAEACRLVEPILDPARNALRAQQFIAWRALSACGRKTDADRVAAILGIR
jgi:tetratricopeptide (TPR) repeat protein